MVREPPGPERPGLPKPEPQERRGLPRPEPAARSLGQRAQAEALRIQAAELRIRAEQAVPEPSAEWLQPGQPELCTELIAERITVKPEESAEQRPAEAALRMQEELPPAAVQASARRRLA